MVLGKAVHSLVEGADPEDMDPEDQVTAQGMAEKGRKILAERTETADEIYQEWSCGLQFDIEGKLNGLTAAVGGRWPYTDAHVAGTLDVLILEAGSIRILDWKSGWKAESDRLQALHYTLIAARWFEVSADQITFEFIHLRGRGGFEIYTFSDAELTDWEARLKAWPTEYDTSPRPGPHCGYCPWASDCPARTAWPTGAVPANREEADLLAAKVLVDTGALAQDKAALQAWMDANGPAQGWAWKETVKRAWDVQLGVERLGGLEMALAAKMLKLDGIKAKGKKMGALLGDDCYTEVYSGGWEPAKAE